MKPQQFTLKNNDIKVMLTNVGASVMAVYAPDRDGKLDEITLSYPQAEDYQYNPASLGSTIGRVINRIRCGRFSYAGETYQLDINDGKHHLHGGLKGFAKVLWQAKELKHKADQAIEFSYHSPAGESGYPGNVEVKVCYCLTADNSLQINYYATTDKVTPLNLSNHTYWNLAGTQNDNVLSHKLYINAHFYMPTDQDYLPTGEVLAVKASEFDFRKAKLIGEDFPQLANGYDCCFVIHKPHASMGLAARVEESKTGRILEVYTDQPGLQLYTGNHLAELDPHKVAKTFGQYQAFCLEAQNFADAVNLPHFPSPFIKPGEVYQQTTIYKFLTST